MTIWYGVGLRLNDWLNGWDDFFNKLFSDSIINNEIMTKLGFLNF